MGGFTKNEKKGLKESQMSPIDWSNLRVWNGSQHAAFEELICQLAATEPMPVGSKFIRKGAPDAGVECFWTLLNGDEYGWQAKFFRLPPGHSQWNQLDDSVNTALEKHPRLKKYTVCLPLNRADARREDQISFLDRWNEMVSKWEQRAKSKGMIVKYEFWGESEIALRLTKDSNAGRVFYWFNKETFSNQWFSNHIDEAVSNVGPRYTPEINVSLPIARIFDGLCRTERFYKNLNERIAEVKKQFSKKISWFTYFPDRKIIEEFRTYFVEFIYMIEKIDQSREEKIDFKIFVQKIDDIENIGMRCSRILYDLMGPINPSVNKEKKRLNKLYENMGNNLDEFLTSLHYFGLFCMESEAQLMSLPYLLLVGDAGAGKTHLFCDIAVKRIKAGLPTLFLNGMQFTVDEPWSQIVKLLGLECKKEQFLAALDSVAEARRSRVLLIIDALNEGEGPKLWKKHLAGMISAVKRYPRLAFAISLRTSYETLVIPPNLVPDRLLRFEHNGFDGHEFEASTSFFRHYKIEQPSVPFLHSEFRNPLFLKLLCEGLKNRGLSQIPPGFVGVSTIFDFFIESVESKLSSPSALDYDPASHATAQAISLLARRMADKGVTWVPRAEAAELINRVLARNDGFDRSLFRHLLCEGVIVEDRRHHDGAWIDIIHFCYERFSDHRIAFALLDDHLNLNDIIGSFAKGTALGRYCESPEASARYQGFLNAFAIQLPERFGVELHDAAHDISMSSPLQTAFIESLVWRNPKATTESAKSTVASILACNYGTKIRFELLNAIIKVGPKDNHPFNADWLHEILWPIPMPDRDTWWSEYLHYQSEKRGAPSVLIQWANTSESKDHVEDVTIFRMATILIWCLSTSNRFVRDKATKGLVALLENRIAVLRQLLNRFIGVNDPYVAERLHAVALGCAMRSFDTISVIALGQDIYNQVFHHGKPPVDIMLRSYAKETVEESIRRGLCLSNDNSLILPPYGSEWDPNVPTDDELRERAEGTALGGKAPGVYALTSSVLQDGDFSRYILGANGGGVPWSSVPLSEPIDHVSMRFRFNRFIESLTLEQKTLWDDYTSIQTAMDLQDQFKNSSHDLNTGLGVSDAQENIQGEPEGDGERGIKFPFNDILLDSLRLDILGGLTEDQKLKVLQGNEAEFIDSLDKNQLAEFKFVQEFPKNQYRYDEDTAFDSSLVERWILHHVLEIGWRSDKHGFFESIVQENTENRDSHKPERIGKKYQWIALRECYARIADNFHFQKDKFANKPQYYRGTWQLNYLRDIDPTCTFKGHSDCESERLPEWYFTPSYDWDQYKLHGEWIKTVDDFPDIKKFVTFLNPKDGQEWLILGSEKSWDEARLGPGKFSEYPFRRMYCNTQAFLVSSTDFEIVYEWAGRQDFMERKMPECPDIYNLYYRECFLSSAFADTIREDPEMFQSSNVTDQNHPFTIFFPMFRYIREGNGYDCSIDRSVSLYLPSPMLVKGMGLSMARGEGRYNDLQGQLVALDTISEGTEANSFAVRRHEFETYLAQMNLRVFWTVQGGKDIIHDHHPKDEDFLGRFVLNGALCLDQEGVKGKASALIHKRGGIEVLGYHNV